MTVSRQWLVPGMVALAMLAGCSGRPKPVPIDTGPDEFSVLPSRPLELPDDYTQLPPPDPEARDRAAPRPEADAVAALGGDPERLELDGAAPEDQSFINQTSRYGVDPAIRHDLDGEDEEAAPRKSRLGRLFGRVFKRGKKEPDDGPVLDASAENERFRRDGVRTPSAPPTGN